MPQTPPQASVWEVFRVFLKLGLTSFGGPVAHLGYFRDEFVTRRKWISDQSLADLIAFCQFLPGPASSQVGMSIGLHGGGFPGLLAAWTAFTLPSALLMFAFAYGALHFGDSLGQGWVLGLKAATVAIVAHAVLGMGKKLAPDRERASIALLGMLVTLSISEAWGQILAIFLGGVLGFCVLKELGETTDHESLLNVSVSKGTAIAAFLGLVGLLIALPIWASITDNPGARLFDKFFRVGSLVFGGGHVVLPLLEAEMVEPALVTREDFLAGYGLAQAVPGPLFTFSSYLGAVTKAPLPSAAKSAIALVGIFSPSFLLIVAGLPFWNSLRKAARARRFLQGVNASVVGLLASALYDPVFIVGIQDTPTISIAAASFVLLRYWNCPAWLLVIIAGAIGAVAL